jgi:S-adenosylmethionine-dependent methyltransferase
VPLLSRLLPLSGGQHTELIAIGIGHGRPADLTVADVDASRPDGDETVDLRLLITVNGWSQVEVQPVPPGPRHQWRTAPGDLRTAVRRADRGLLVLVPDQRPPQRLTPEVPDRLRAVARKRADEPTVGEEGVTRPDDAELVAFGVGEHHMALIGALADVDVPGAEPDRPRHRVLLVLEGRTRQVEVHLVLTGLLFPSRKKSDPEPGVITRQERNVIVGIIGHLPTQDARPEPRKTERVVRIEAEREEVRRHPARTSDLLTRSRRQGTSCPMRDATLRRSGRATQRGLNHGATLPDTPVSANLARRPPGMAHAPVPSGSLYRGVVGDDTWAGLADQFADEAYASVKGRVRTYVLHHQLLEHLPAPPASVLDVGGGAGHQSFPLAQAGYDVTVLDPSSAMLDKAQQRLQRLPDEVQRRVSLVEAEGENADEAVHGQRFAAVLCHGVLGYLDQPEPVADQLCRCAAAGGIVSIMAGNARASAVRPALERRWDDALASFDARSEIGVLGVPTRADTVEELSEVVRSRGVEPLRWYGVWLFVDWLAFSGAELDPSDSSQVEAAAAVELEASRRDPYRQLSRIFHLVGRKGRG